MKKFLMVLLASVFATGAYGYKMQLGSKLHEKYKKYKLKNIKVYNETKGAQATKVLVQLVAKPALLTEGLVMNRYTLNADSETPKDQRNISRFQHRTTRVRVKGLSGAGRGQSAEFVIDGKLSQHSSLKLDVDMKRNKLFISKH